MEMRRNQSCIQDKNTKSKWIKTTMSLILLLELTPLVDSRDTFVINYNLYQGNAHSINYFMSGPQPEMKKKEQQQEQLTGPEHDSQVIDAGKVSDYRAQPGHKPAEQGDGLTLRSDEEVEEACRICSQYKALTYKGLSEHQVEAIPLTMRPNVGRPIRLSRSTTLVEDLVTFINSHQNLTSLDCGPTTFLFKSEKSRRTRREANPVRIGKLESGNDTRLIIGKCKEASKVPPHNRLCQHWFGVEYREQGSCGFLASCDPGYSFRDSMCVLNDKDPEDLSICSDKEVQFSSTAIAPSPYLPKFSDDKVCFNSSVNLAKSCKGTQAIRRVVSLIGINDGEKIVTKLHSFIFKPDYSSILNYQCKGCSNTESCSHCKGDDFYNKHMAASDVKLQCTCSILDKPVIGQLSIVVDDLSLPVSYRASSMEWVMIIEDGNKPQTESSCFGCQVTCENGNVKLIDFPDSSDLIKLCMFALCTTVPFKSTVEVPLAYLLIPSSLRVTVFSKQTVVANTNLNCARLNSCDVIKCHLCWQRILNPSCYEVLDGLTAFICSLMLLLILSIILKSLRIVWMLLNISKVLFIALYRICKACFVLSLKCCGQSLLTTRRVYRRVEKIGECEEILITSETPQSVKMVPTQKRVMSHQEWKLLGMANKSAKSSLLIISLLTGVLLLSSVSACTNVSHLNFTSQDCKPVNGEVVCTQEDLIELEVGTSGGDACLLVQNSDGIMGSVHIAMSSVKTRCSEEFLYWTYDTEPLVQTNCHCWGEVHCRESSCTATNVSSEILTSEGIMTGVGPGLVSCSKVKSEFLGKCVLPLDGCCFYSISFPSMKTPSVYKVLRCPSYYWEIGLTVKTMLSGIPDVRRIKATVGVEKQVGLLQVLASHISSPPSPIRGSCLIESSLRNESFYAQCNLPSETVLGRIGEIQCPTERDARLATEKCKWVQSMVSIQTDFTQIKPHINYLRISKSLSGLKLPLLTPTINIKRDEYGYYTTSSLSEAFSIRVKLPPMSILQFSDLSPCILRFIRITGCFECMQGASLQLHATCDKYPALAKLTCPSMTMSIPVVINQSGNTSVRLIMTKPNVDETCKYEAGLTKGEIAVKGVLLVVPKITEGTFNSFNQITNNSTSGVMITLQENMQLLLRSITSFFATMLPWWVGVLIMIGLTLIVLKLAPQLLRSNAKPPRSLKTV